MNLAWWTAGVAGLLGATALIFVWRRARSTGLDRWLPSYLLSKGARRVPRPGDPIHVFLCVADHYEPKHGGAGRDVARKRVQRWLEEYPKLFSEFRDSDGMPPQHTFFYPAEEYEPDLLDGVARLCRQGFGEIEVHLHHDDDTADNLTAQLDNFKAALASRHESLGRRRDNGDVGFVFIHGNWALDNARPDGRMCGVNNELDVLLQSGCIADMTYPSYPSTTQPPTCNSIYRAVDDPQRPRSHDRGTPVRAGTPPVKGLLLVNGPLVLDWTRRKFRLLPRIENGCLQNSQPPAGRRLDQWLRAAVRVQGRPDWYFVKVYTHGAVEGNADVLLGPPMVDFHRELARRQRNGDFQFHYVTAREMVNVILAAEAGIEEWRTDVRDFVWAPPPLRSDRRLKSKETSIA
jgi:hypothetical protein